MKSRLIPNITQLPVNILINELMNSFKKTQKKWIANTNA